MVTRHSAPWLPDTRPHGYHLLVDVVSNVYYYCELITLYERVAPCFVKYCFYFAEDLKQVRKENEMYSTELSTAKHHLMQGVDLGFHALPFPNLLPTTLPFSKDLPASKPPSRSFDIIYTYI